MAVTANTEVKVYASFPRVVALGADLNLDADNWHWVLCLTLPLEILNVLHFSPRPYKWIRYAVGIVVGAEGHLSSNSEFLKIVDYNAGLPTKSTVLYYYTDDDERQRMSPVDPKTVRTKVTSSITTFRSSRFRSDLADRDGNRCVLTEMDALSCDAVHLLPKSKGDTVCLLLLSFHRCSPSQWRQYISIYTERRSRDPAGGDLIQDIDNVRNGLFLNKLTHVGVGEDVAFLPVRSTCIQT